MYSQQLTEAGRGRRTRRRSPRPVNVRAKGSYTPRSHSGEHDQHGQAFCVGFLVTFLCSASAGGTRSASSSAEPPDKEPEARQTEPPQRRIRRAGSGGCTPTPARSLRLTDAQSKKIERDLGVDGAQAAREVARAREARRGAGQDASRRTPRTWRSSRSRSRRSRSCAPRQHDAHGDALPHAPAA